MRRTPDLERAARAVASLLEAAGLDPASDPELADTPERVARALLHELLSGYDQDPAAILAERTASRARGIVALRDVDVVTTCPHHLMVATGTAHVAYAPGRYVVGLGALGRLLDCLSRRLVLQEDLAASVCKALVQHAHARAAVCVLELRPGCVVARGERRHRARAVSIAWSGPAVNDPAVRADLLAAVGRPGAARRGATTRRGSA
ncbi:MAG: GTP cyclohydrolase I [Myxococcota bacterium]|nr:GTP cyclohydrolase I [Myxococcota bacterium]